MPALSTRIRKAAPAILWAMDSSERSSRKERMRAAMPAGDSSVLAPRPICASSEPITDKADVPDHASAR